MRLLYNIFLKLYKAAIWLASLFNPKAKKWINGRKESFIKLRKFAQDNPKNIWIHCASVGEFEQGFPIINKLQLKFPNHKILLSFFSPSGYDFVSKKYPELSTIYLPLDTKKNATKWTTTLAPEAVFFVKYEFWHYYFLALKQQDIPLFMVSAVFWEELFFFKRYGKFFRKALKNVTHFFLQDKKSQELLSKIGINNTTVTGDARFERVLDLKQQAFSDPKINDFILGNNVFIAGSTWEEDIPVVKKIIESLPAFFKIIIAPHEIDDFPYHKFKSFASYRYSEESKIDSKILFLDTIGKLSRIYRYADLVYIGGGFGKGIHNVLEAAVYNTPILIGPNYQRFIEAKQLLRNGLLHIIENIESVDLTIERVLNTKPETIRINKAFFDKNANVSEQIIVFIKKHAFLD